MYQVVDYYSIWPPVVCTTVLMLVAAAPLFRVLDSPPTAHLRSARTQTVDGLRGYLALAVVFHHVAILHGFLQKRTFRADTWRPPPSHFYSMIGPAGVSMFFMITGYLFWFRVVKSEGTLDWFSLYVGRVFRIGPLYLVAVGLASTLDHLSRFNYVARVSGASASWIKQVCSIGLLGLSVYPDNNKLLAGVSWSIQYEWLFYASLPLLAIVLLKPRSHVPLLTTAIVVCLALRVFSYHVPPGTRTLPVILALFLIGMTCASLQALGLVIIMPAWLVSPLICVAASCIFLFRDIYSAGPLLLLGIAFYLIISGGTVFGLLTMRPAIRLGNASYGLYLLQGAVLSVCFRPVALRNFVLASPVRHWLMTTAALVLLLACATVTYYFIERRGIAAGRRVVGALKARRPVLLESK